MKVDGAAFKAARKKIRAKFPGRGEAGQPAMGTQEWVAEEARLSLRAVQYLERGEASQKTLIAASQLLNIPDWQTLIHNFGIEYVTCSAPKVIDFRPERHPPSNPDNYLSSVMLMTIDPLSMLVESGKFDHILLQEVRATLTGLDVDIDFIWLANVLLTPAGRGWLGWESEVEAVQLEANDQILNMSIMFRQSAISQVNWQNFIEMVDKSTKNQLNIDLEIQFSSFTKHLKIFISTELLQRIFAEGRSKYDSPHPYRAQIRTIT